MNKRQTFSIFFLFIIIAIAIMSPIASHDVVPQFGDFTYHLENILAAHQAIQNGDYWPRVVTGGWFYPTFQFYAPFTYIIGGYVAFISHNPLDPFKLALGLSLVLGGWYCYKLYLFLFKNEVAALLGAVLYLFSPYLLININVRGDFTEAFTQGFLPIPLYYAFRIFFAERLDTQKLYFMFAGIFSFYLLALCHLITFLYSSLFLFVLLFFCSFQQKKWRSFLAVLGCFAFALVLAAWYLAPLAKYEHLLAIGAHGLTTPWSTVFLTEISTLLSPRGISPSAWFTNIHFPLYPGLGMPITMAALYWLYRVYGEKVNAPLPKVAVWTFLFVFLFLWSPTDFWEFLPHQFYILQFTYRLLTDIMWLGGILFTAALVDIFKGQLDRRHLFVGVFAIGLSSAGWMQSNYNNTNIPPSVPTPIPMHVPSNYIAGDYLVDPAFIQIKPHYSPTLNTKLLPVNLVEKNCTQSKAISTCTLNTTQAETLVQLPILYYPQLLQIKVNDKKVEYSPSPVANNQFVAAVALPPGQAIITSQFKGLVWANVLSSIAAGIYCIGIIGFSIYYRRYILRIK